MSPSKPYTIDYDDLPPPIPCMGYPSSRPHRHPILDALAGPLWLAAGMTIAVLAMTSPGCVGTGGPTVSAKADLSVKEVAHLASVGGGGPTSGTGELTSSVSITLAWPARSTNGR